MKAEAVICAMQAFVEGDRDRAMSIVTQIAAAEAGAGRTSIASRLRCLSQNQMIRLPSAPEGMNVYEPRSRLCDVWMTPVIEQAVRGLADEHACAAAIRDRGLRPLSKLLLHGPTGCGKTMLCEAIAAELRLPFVLVDQSAIVGSHMGESAKALVSVFRFAETTPVFVLFDECDSYVTSRAGSGDAVSRESNRMVNQILTSLDRTTTGVVAFASNLFDELDGAFVRRMELVMHVPSPEADCMAEFVAAKCRQYGIGPLDSPFENYAAATVEIEREAKRQIVLQHKAAGDLFVPRVA